MFTAVIKLQREFYFRFRSAYHVTLSRGLYPGQGTTHNGHQRATWHCLQSTTHSGPQTTQLAVPRSLSRGCRKELPPNVAVLN